MLGGYVGVERHGNDIIGGVAGGGQRAAPLAGLVDGHNVTHPLGNVLSFDRLQPHLGETEETEVAQRVTGSNDVIMKLKLWLPPLTTPPPLATSANSHCHLKAVNIKNI